MMEKNSPWIVPGILNWAEKLSGEVIVQPLSVSCIWVKRRVGAVYSPVVQKRCNTGLDPRGIVAVGIVCPIM